jgi:hypothetical protein
MSPDPESGAKSRKSYLSTLQLARLEHACSVVAKAFDHPPYLVGTATESPDWRDVDVRLILPDDEFDSLFKYRGGKDFPGGLWGLMCLTISHYLADTSGLPVDFQIQRMTEANEKFGGKPRNPLGHGFREFAGGGDAT